MPKTSLWQRRKLSLSFWRSLSATFILICVCLSECSITTYSSDIVFNFQFQLLKEQNSVDLLITCHRHTQKRSIVFNLVLFPPVLVSLLCLRISSTREQKYILWGHDLLSEYTVLVRNRWWMIYLTRSHFYIVLH